MGVRWHIKAHQEQARGFLGYRYGFLQPLYWAISQMFALVAMRLPLFGWANVNKPG